MKVDVSKFQKLIDDRYISVQKHPEEDLFIYNYSPKCQYERLWTPETLMCRGLILDKEGEIIARPFTKFFNLEEHLGGIPSEGFTVSEKMDGSLGILYWIKDKPFIATRGSFMSEQAIEGTKMIQEMEDLWSHLWTHDLTYLFEIIYPQNRIVVDYGDKRGLVYLTAVHKETGLDVEHDLPCETAPRYHGVKDIKALKELNEKNKEGFVVYWESGLRLKVKFEEYVRLHRLVTGLNTRVIWEAQAIEALRDIGISDPKEIGFKLNIDANYIKEMFKTDGHLLDRLVDRVPDEVYQWMNKVVEDAEYEFEKIFLDARNAFAQMRLNELPRKEAAAKVKVLPKEIRPILFNMLDGKECVSNIWMLLYPKHSKPFKVEV